MTNHEKYEQRLNVMRSHMALLMEGIPPGPLGFLSGDRHLLRARKMHMLLTWPTPRLIEFGMYNSYRRCRMN